MTAKDIAAAIRERITELEAEVARLKRAAYELDPRGRKPAQDGGAED